MGVARPVKEIVKYAWDILKSGVLYFLTGRYFPLKCGHKYVSLKYK